jgi:hypothetical protein
LPITNALYVVFLLVLVVLEEELLVDCTLEIEDLGVAVVVYVDALVLVAR